MRDLTEIIRVKESVKAELLGRPGVTGVGVGLRFVGGKPTDEIAIQVFVSQKREVPEAERIPTEIRGFKTDVFELRPKLCVEPDTAIYRPLRGGIQLQIAEITTLGTLVDLPGDLAQKRAALSTAHGLASIGDPVYQGIDPTNQIGTYIGRVIKQVYDADADACLIRLDLGMPSRCGIVEIGGLNGVKEPEIKMLVRKRGRTTRLTQGRVVSLSVDVVWSPKTYTNLIGVQSTTPGSPMAMPGDSGSVLVDEDNYAVGLVVGSDFVETAFCHHISTVLQRLDVTLCSGDGDRETKLIPDLMVQILLGLIQGGGGIVITPGGVIKKIPTGDPVFSERVREILSLLSVGELVQTLKNPALRENLTRMSLEEVVKLAKSLMPKE